MAVPGPDHEPAVGRLQSSHPRRRGAAAGDRGICSTIFPTPCPPRRPRAYPPPPTAPPLRPLPAELGETERAVAGLLGREPVLLDELIARSGRAAARAAGGALRVGDIGGRGAGAGADVSAGVSRGWGGAYRAAPGRDDRAPRCIFPPCTSTSTSPSAPGAAATATSPSPSGAPFPPSSTSARHSGSGTRRRHHPAWEQSGIVRDHLLRRRHAVAPGPGRDRAASSIE